MNAEATLAPQKVRPDTLPFSAVYDQFIDRIYRYVVRDIGDHAAAQDVVGTVFEKALKNYAKFNARHENSLQSWLYTIARNEVISWFRRQKHRNHASLVANNHVSSVNVERSFQMSERQRAIYQVIDQLKPEEYRDVIVLRLVEGLDSAETAAILGWTSDKVQVTLSRARKKLRQLLIDQQIVEVRHDA